MLKMGGSGTDIMKNKVSGTKKLATLKHVFFNFSAKFEKIWQILVNFEPILRQKHLNLLKIEHRGFGAESWFKKEDQWNWKTA